VRHLWEDYLASPDQVSAILFLVDATDSDRFEEAGYELDALLSLGSSGNSNPQPSHARNGNHLSVSVPNDGGGGGEAEQDDDLNGSSPSASSAAAHSAAADSSWRVPVAILLNKCDLQDEAAATPDVLEKLDFGHLQALHPPHLLQVFRISVLTGEGYPQAFQWLSTFL
jgi:hypothetical protein